MTAEVRCPMCDHIIWHCRVCHEIVRDATAAYWHCRDSEMCPDTPDPRQKGFDR